jgi:hypothetical protein
MVIVFVLNLSSNAFYRADLRDCGVVRTIFSPGLSTTHEPLSPQDRQLFMHEYRSSAAYSCTTLILAYTLMELPSQIFAALVSYSLVSDLPNADDNQLYAVFVSCSSREARTI